MRAFANGMCFWCTCKTFACPSCGLDVVLKNVDEGLHVGICDVCGPVDTPCVVRTAPRENIFGA